MAQQRLCRSQQMGLVLFLIASLIWLLQKPVDSAGRFVNFFPEKNRNHKNRDSDTGGGFSLGQAERDPRGHWRNLILLKGLSLCLTKYTAALMLDRLSAVTDYPAPVRCLPLPLLLTGISISSARPGRGSQGAVLGRRLAFIPTLSSSQSSGEAAKPASLSRCCS